MAATTLTPQTTLVPSTSLVQIARLQTTILCFYTSPTPTLSSSVVKRRGQLYLDGSNNIASLWLVRVCMHQRLPPVSRSNSQAAVQVRARSPCSCRVRHAAVWTRQWCSQLSLCAHVYQSSSLQHRTLLTVAWLLLDECCCRAGYVRDPETQMADKAAAGTELSKVRWGCRGMLLPFSTFSAFLCKQNPHTN